MDHGTYLCRIRRPAGHGAAGGVEGLFVPLKNSSVAELRNSAAGYLLTETDKMEEVSVK